MSADKYLSIFSRQMEAIVYIYLHIVDIVVRNESVHGSLFMVFFSSIFKLYKLIYVAEVNECTCSGVLAHGVWNYPRDRNRRVIHNYKILSRVFLQKYKYRCCLADAYLSGFIFSACFWFLETSDFRQSESMAWNK